MLEILKFVRAAVCKEGHVPSRMHFRIRSGTIQANNGKLAIQCPFPSDIDCCPHAGQFYKAIAACEDVISMHIESGKLIVRSGRFRSVVDLCDSTSFHDFIPIGQRVPVPQPMLPILRKLIPFVTDDERRPWACGVHFDGNSAMATNSICIVQHWLPLAFPVPVNIPKEAVSELLRLKIEPLEIQFSVNAVVFHLPDNAWIACIPIEYKWPDTSKVFATAENFAGTYTNEAQLNSLLNDVAKLDGFTNELGVIYFHKGTVSTVPSGRQGTSIDCPFSPGVGVFRADQLAALRGIVDCIGFTAYPSPVPFYGGKLLRGVMAGFQS